MPVPDPNLTTESAPDLSRRLALAERALAARDKTIEALVQRERDRTAQRHSSFDAMEENTALQDVVVRETRELEAQNARLNREIGLRTAAEAERERVLAEVRFTHQRMNELIATIPASVWRSEGAPTSPEQRVVFVSDYAERLLGYSPQEWMSAPALWLSLVHPADREHAAREMTAVFEDMQPREMEFRVMHKDGRIVWTESRVTVLRDESGRPIGTRGVTLDITARKEAEAELQEQEDKLRRIVEHSTQVFYSHDPAGLLTYLSPRAKDFLDCSPAEALRPWTEFLTDHPGNAEGVKITQQATDTGEPQHPYQLQFKTGKGRIIWVEVHESPVVVAGQTVAMVGALTEITARVEAEARQRVEEDRYVLQRAALIAFTATRDGENLLGTLQRLTETAARTLNVERVSLWRYNSDRTAIHCVDLYELEANRHSAGLELSGTDYPGYFRALEEFDVLAADDARSDPRTCEFAEGYLRPLGIHSMLDAPISLGGLREGVLCHEHTGPGRHWTTDEETFAVAVANRISLALEGAERRRAGVELRSAHAQLEQLLAHSPAVLYRLKLAGAKVVPLMVTANIERLLGFTTAETLRDEWWPERIHPQDRDRAWAIVPHTLTHGATHTEYRIGHRDGSYRWVDDRQRLVSDLAGEPAELVGVWVDITERKQSEIAIQQLQSEMLAVSRQAGMAEVATSVLHNVGNVLNSVNISATLASARIRKSAGEDVARIADLLQEHAGDLPGFFANDPRGAKIPAFLQSVGEHSRAEQKALLAEMQSLVANVDHIKEIVAMQQSYARVAGVVETVPSSELIEHALRLNAGSMERHGIEVVREFAEVPPIAVEKHKVIQVLVNLIRNAQHACEEGGRADKRIWLRIGPNGSDGVKISVADNGIGIPPENLTRIFGHGFTTRRDGHGWGLHSGALAARELGGSLRAESAGLGRGATFTLELPLDQKPNLA